jgi:hypothetical protein
VLCQQKDDDHDDDTDDEGDKFTVEMCNPLKI